MYRLTVLMVISMAGIPGLAIGEQLHQSAFLPSYDLAYGCFDPAAFIQVSGLAVSKVLDHISNVQQRQKLAEEWLQFSRQSITKTLEFRQEWLKLQKENLRLQEQIEQLRLEQLKLQAEIEKLQTEKLHLEKEKLELQAKLQKETGKP